MDLNETSDQTVDCEDSDVSIELTEDDKRYTEKLMLKHLRLKANNHEDIFKSVSNCHICDKIKLSTNPESTNTFLDLIFMDHENDFEFTKEKRQKIIRSLVHDFFKAELKNKYDRISRKGKVLGSKIKNSRAIRKNLNTSLSHKLKQKSTRIIPDVNKYIPRNDEYDGTFNQTFSMIKPLESQENQLSRSNVTYDKTERFESAEEYNHTNAENLENFQYPVYNRLTIYKSAPKMEVRPVTGTPLTKMRYLNHMNRYKVNNKVRGTKMMHVNLANFYKKNTNRFKMSRNPKQDVEPKYVIRKIEPEDNKGNPLSAPPDQNEKPGFSKIPKYDYQETHKRRPIPIRNPRDPFYIPEAYMDVALYQQGLEYEGWNPTQVLYEICGYCRWGKPEFLEGGNPLGGFLCCVRVKGFSFVARTRGQTKKIARHLASTYFLNRIGFKFEYDLHSRVPMKNIYGGERFAPPPPACGKNT